MGVAITLVFRVILLIGAGISHIGLYGMLQGIEGGDMMRDAIRQTAIIALAKYDISAKDTHEA